MQEPACLLSSVRKDFEAAARSGWIPPVSVQDHDGQRCIVPLSVHNSECIQMTAMSAVLVQKVILSVDKLNKISLQSEANQV